MKKQPKSTAKAASSNSKTAATSNKISSPLKTKKMGKKIESAIKINMIAKYSEIYFTKKGKLSTRFVEVKPSSQKVQNILEEIMEMNEQPIICLGYEDHILGFDPESYVLVYDGIGMVNQLVKENMEFDKKQGDVEMSWEDYYDDAYDTIYKGIANHVSLFTGNSPSNKKDDKKRIDPIILFPVQED